MKDRKGISLRSVKFTCWWQISLQIGLIFVKKEKKTKTF